MDIVDRLRFDAIRCETTFSKGVASNITEAADAIEKLRKALTVLLDEATSFSVSGVYFDEECMGHKGPELARQALSISNGDRDGRS